MVYSFNFTTGKKPIYMLLSRNSNDSGAVFPLESKKRTYTHILI